MSSVQSLMINVVIANKSAAALWNVLNVYGHTQTIVYVLTSLGLYMLDSIVKL